MDTRSLLLDSVQQISELRPEQGGLDSAATAFNSFRKGVVHASSGRTGTPEELLGDLEPKDHIFRFLIGVYHHRRILRKQVGAVFSELLSIDAWKVALTQDRGLSSELPDELASLLAENLEQDVSEPPTPASPSRHRPSFDAGTNPFEVQVAPPAAAGSAAPAAATSQSGNPFEVPSASSTATSPQASSQPRMSKVREVISKAATNNGISLPIRPSGPTSTGHYAGGNIQLSRHELEAVEELLQKGRSQIESLDFNASDIEKAIAAFETFRRAVQQVVNSTLSKQEDNPLERLEPKGRLLEFLVDMYERHQKYRSRITSTLMRLLNFEGWSYAADNDASVQAAVCDFQDMRAMGKVTSIGGSLNLKSAAATAVARGGVGALFVQILAGHNLLAADSNGTSDPYVRVRLGSRTQRTPVICDTLNPKWNATPFIFEVPALDAKLKFECLDSDFFKDDPLGDLEMSVADAPMDPAKSIVRFPLRNVEHGELEFKLIYMHGKGSLPEQDVAVQKADVVEAPSPLSPVASAAWTPWGPAAAAESTAPPMDKAQKESAQAREARRKEERRRMTNPFELMLDDKAGQPALDAAPDHSGKGYAGGVDSWMNVPVAATASTDMAQPHQRRPSTESQWSQLTVQTVLDRRSTTDETFSPKARASRTGSAGMSEITSPQTSPVPSPTGRSKPTNPFSADTKRVNAAPEPNPFNPFTKK